MTFFTYKLNVKHIITFTTLTLFSILLWFGISYLGIATLQTTEKKSYIIALIFLVWILTLIWSKPIKQLPTAIPNTAEAQNQLQALKARFFGAIQFLKKTFIQKNEKNFRLAELPWYLLIGPSGAGKTHFLAHSNVNYILTKQFKQEIIPTSENCDWWVTRDLVLIDVPGFYLAEKDNFLWNHFLNLMNKTRPKRPLDAIVVALPFPELMKQKNLSQKKQMVNEIKNKITQLHEQFGTELSVYFIITKCDQLPGFVDFFNESSMEELAQPWGITLPARKEHETLLDVFIQRFDALIKRLNSQLIWHLHQERNPNARPAIKDFPLQMEKLKETIVQFVKALGMNNLPLQGVYLTSALQNNEEQGAHSNIINASTNQMQLLRYPTTPSKPYFIRQCILQGLLAKTDSTPTQISRKFVWQKRAVYAASVITISIALILLGNDFQQGVLQTYAIQNDLAQYQLAIQQSPQETDHLLKALPLLNELKSAATYTNHNLSHYALLSFYSDKSHQIARSVYQKALQTIVLPEIKNNLEKYINANNNKNASQLYAALKAYLMLGDHRYLQEDFFMNVISQVYLEESHHNDLINHIHAALSQSNPILLNNDVINKARNQLASLNSQDLGEVILKNITNNTMSSVANLGASIASVFLNDGSTLIPDIYTANAYNSMISQKINAAATEALQGNWVLGNAEVLSNEATINALAEQLRARYIANYISTWENVINNIKLVTPTNLQQTDFIITTITSNTSPLLQLLQAINTNTSFAPVISGSPKIQMFNNLLTNANNNQENSLYQIFTALRQLHFYLQTVLDNTDVGNAAFDAAKKRMQTTEDPITQIHLIAENNPEPLRSWLNSLSAQSWYYILQETSHYIENAWQVNIASIYSSQFAARYPLNQSANTQVDLQQFANFVGKQGTLSNFYQRYLKPFIKDDTKEWQWRTVDNQKLPFANNVLAQIQRSVKLQNMSKFSLFAQGHNNPALKQFQLPEQLTDVS